MPDMAMAREVRISDRASRDLARIWQWGRVAGSEEHARLTLKTISRAIKNLPFTPLASPMRPDTGARERAVDHHVIVYDVEAGGGLGPSAGHVNVLGIVGPFLDEEPKARFEV
jgi:plasmid stabilization system protein ParE